MVTMLPLGLGCPRMDQEGYREGPPVVRLGDLNEKKLEETRVGSSEPGEYSLVGRVLGFSIHKTLALVLRPHNSGRGGTQDSGNRDRSSRLFCSSIQPGFRGSVSKP